MKYKFLYKQYKTSREEVNLEVLDEDSIQDMYTRAYQKVYEFKEKNTSINTNILDKLIDNLILNNVILINDPYKEFKNIIKLMRNTPIYELKVIRKFRLQLEKECATLCCEDIEDICTDSILSMIIMIMFTCEGFILYKPLKVRDSYINLGKDLDTLYDIGEIKGKHPLVAYKAEALPPDITELLDNISNKALIEITNKSLGKALKHKSFYGIFTHQYIFLTDFCFSMQNEEVCNIMSAYIDEDTFKFSASVSLDNTKEYPTLMQRMRMVKSPGELFQNREVLIPSSGVYLRYSDGYSVLYEYEDEVLGRAISWYTHGYNDIYNGSKTVYLESKLDTIYALGGGDKAILELIKVDKYFEEFEEFIGLAVYMGENGVVSRAEKMSSLYDFAYEAYVPRSWKDIKYSMTSNNKRLPKESDKTLYGEEIKTLSPFKRKLPVGQSRSEEADRLAKKLCIKLAPDETVVRQFERKQRVRIK